MWESMFRGFFRGHPMVRIVPHINTFGNFFMRTIMFVLLYRLNWWLRVVFVCSKTKPSSHFLPSVLPVCLFWLGYAAWEALRG